MALDVGCGYLLLEQARQQRYSHHHALGKVADDGGEQRLVGEAVQGLHLLAGSSAGKMPKAPTA
jgi:hypothetical protein